MIKWIIPFIFCLFSLVSFAKNRQNAIQLSTLKGYTYFFDMPNVQVLETEKGASIKAISKQLFTNEKRNLKINHQNAYWFKLNLHNNIDSYNEWYIYTGNNDYADIYLLDGNILKLKGKTGTYCPTPQLQIPNIANYVNFKIEPQKTQQIYLKVYNKKNINPDLNITIEDKATYNEEIYKAQKAKLKETFIVILFVGSIGFIFLFMIFLYFKSYQKLYLYYSLYLLGTIIYALTRLNRITWIGSMIDYYPLMRSYINEPIQFLFFAVYNWFVIELLNIGDYDTKLVRFLKILSYCYMIYAGLNLLMMITLFDFQLRNILFIGTRIILFPLNIGLIIWFYIKVKSPIINYFFLGVFFYLTGGIIAALADTNFRLFGDYQIGLTAANIFQLGILAEVLCFSLAIGYRIKLNEDEKKESKDALINQLQINQKLIKNSNDELEQKIKIRTEEIIQKKQEIEIEKITTLQINYEKKLAEAEMMALRSQMNPHFLFNSLSSIRYFILSNQNDKAADYLNKFSKLIRLVLEHSKKELVSLNSELEALSLYLAIEANRFNDQFFYKINVVSGVDTNEIFIPPLLLQPFVENAIWHGLLPSLNPTKTLNITIESNPEKHNSYHFIIEDNGIGRAQSALQKDKTLKKHKSYGMDLTKERIKLYNQNFSNCIVCEISDKYDDGIATGTKIIFTIS
jgi:sensor histidine kinase YesM